MMTILYIYLGRPNRELHYFIGEDFCLEQTIENSYFTVTCSLQYPVSPQPEFQFSIFQNDTSLLDTYALANFTRTISESEKSLSMNGNVLPDELGITIVCHVSNINGNDTARTVITLCRKF